MIRSITLLFIFISATVGRDSVSSSSAVSKQHEKTDSSTIKPSTVSNEQFSTDTVSDSISEKNADLDTVGRSFPVEKESVTAQSSRKATPSSVPLIKRSFNYKQQVILALGMMAFVAIIMTTSQNWNPR